jgi:hypothetical protein
LLLDKFLLKKMNPKSSTIIQRTTTLSFFLCVLCAFAPLRDKKRVIAPWRLCVSLFLLFFLSCTTATKAPELTPLESGILPLDEGASAYALIDMAHGRPILEGISYIPLNDKNMKQMLDKTQSAAMAVFTPSPRDDRRYQLVSWGNYPASSAGMAFGSNKDWKKQQSVSSNMVYWHSEKSQISVAVSPSRAYVLAAMTKVPHDPIASTEGIKIPEGFGEFAKGAVFSCWFSDPGPLLNQRLKTMSLPLEIPAEQLFICLFQADKKTSAAQPMSPAEPFYEAQFKIKLPGATQARAVVSLLTLARSFMPAPEPPPPIEPTDTQDRKTQKSAAMMIYILFSNPIVQEEESIILKSPPLGVRDISLLFSVFSL